MGLETGTYISDLVATNPVGATDPKSQGDDHIRLIKATLLATFPNITGAVTPTHTELNYVDGVTSAIQTQLDAKLASASYTAADVLTKIKTVDGAGSGLDADLLDGLSSGAFAQLAVPNTFADYVIIAPTGVGALYVGSSHADGGYMAFQRGGVTKGYLGNSKAVSAGTLDNIELYANASLVLHGTNVALSKDGGLTLAGTDSNMLRLANNTSYISFYDTTNSTRTGYIQFNSGGNTIFKSEYSGGVIYIQATGASVRLSADGGTTDHVVMAATGITTPNAYAAEFGYKGAPLNSQAGNYTLVLSDAGGCIYQTTSSGHTITIPANASVAFPVGTTIVLVNRSGGNNTLAITTDTLQLAGTTTTGSRTLSNGSMATLYKFASTGWMVSGAGVS